MANGKWQMANGKWQMGEPDDDTNFGSHAFPALIRISVKQNS